MSGRTCPARADAQKRAQHTSVSLQKRERKAGCHTAAHLILACEQVELLLPPDAAVKPLLNPTAVAPLLHILLLDGLDWGPWCCWFDISCSTHCAAGGCSCCSSWPAQHTQLCCTCARDLSCLRCSSSSSKAVLLQHNSSRSAQLCKPCWLQSRGRCCCWQCWHVANPVLAKWSSKRPISSSGGLCAGTPIGAALPSSAAAPESGAAANLCPQSCSVLQDSCDGIEHLLCAETALKCVYTCCCSTYRAATTSWCLYCCSCRC